ncbi:hypothetical protein V6N13_089001 [Hibiscus sabdariffa]
MASFGFDGSCGLDLGMSRVNGEPTVMIEVGLEVEGQSASVFVLGVSIKGSSSGEDLEIARPLGSWGARLLLVAVGAMGAAVASPPWHVLQAGTMGVGVLRSVVWQTLEWTRGSI